MLGVTPSRPVGQSLKGAKTYEAKIPFRGLGFLAAIIFIFFLCLLAFDSTAQSARAVVRPTITVSDLDRVLPFYTKTLPFELVGIQNVPAQTVENLFGLKTPGASARIATLKLGTETLDLLDFVNPETGQPIPADSRSNDRWFQHVAIVVSDIDKAYQQLRQQKVGHISSSPQRLPAYLPNAAGVKAFYFRDPDGHALELISFPPGKGNPKWQQAEGKLFLGIDHTAIASADTDTSLAFYRDVLGLKIGGMSENYGTEQEHLNQVFGAHLLITGLTTGTGPGVELLQYLSPPGGRPYPENSHPNDLWHWLTVLTVSGLDELERILRQKNYRILTPGTVPIQYPGISAKRGLLVRDPDGHAMLLCE
jgi:catechol 2,3-dioxygenase-like lactoylglutathione lyase family enzyme